VSINPYFMPSFQDWAQRSIPELEQYGTIQFPPGEDGWKDWASGVVSLNGLAELGAPMPYQFSSWKDWAARLIEVIDNGF
jgi:hypothetical protein